MTYNRDTGRYERDGDYSAAQGSAQPAMPRTRHCMNCGARYTPPETDGNGYCSDDCATDARNWRDPFE